MSKLKDIEHQISNLSVDDRARLRDWLEDQDWQDWDAQIVRDVATGKLDDLMTAAEDDVRAGHTREL
jgi:hypothetical protein